MKTQDVNNDKIVMMEYEYVFDGIYDDIYVLMMTHTFINNKICICQGDKNTLIFNLRN